MTRDTLIDNRRKEQDKRWAAPVPDRALFHTDEAIQQCLQAATADAADRPETRRYPLLLPFRIAANDNRSDTVPAFGCDISTAGIRLLHSDPLQQSRVHLSIPAKFGPAVKASAEITSSTTVGDGWHLSDVRLPSWSLGTLTTFMWSALSGEVNRRLGRRIPHFRPLRIANADGKGGELSGFTRDISRSGIGLLHRGPVRKGHVKASLLRERGQWCDILVDVCWCRSVGDGWYLSGARFVPFLLESLGTRLG